MKRTGKTPITPSRVWVSLLSETFHVLIGQCSSIKLTRALKEYFVQYQPPPLTYLLFVRILFGMKGSIV